MKKFILPFSPNKYTFKINIMRYGEKWGKILFIPVYPYMNSINNYLTKFEFAGIEFFNLIAVKISFLFTTLFFELCRTGQQFAEASTFTKVSVDKSVAKLGCSGLIA